MWGYESKDPNQDWLMSGTSTIINHYQLSSAVVTYHELPYLKNDHSILINYPVLVDVHTSHICIVKLNKIVW